MRLTLLRIRANEPGRIMGGQAMVDGRHGPIRRLALLCVLAFTCAQVQPARAGCSLALATDLPLHEGPDGFVVNVGINGQNAKLKFDTGSIATTLNAASLSHLGLSATGGFSEAYGIGGKRPIFDTWVDLQLGRLHGENTHIEVQELWKARAGDDTDGLFGMNLIAGYDIDIDVPGHHLRLYKPEGACSSPTVALAQPLYTVKLIAADSDLETDIGVGIDGHTVRAELDSGSSRAVMFRRGAERLGLDLSGLTKPGAEQVHGIGPAGVPAIRHVLPAVSVGDLEIRNMPIAILAQRDLGIDRTYIGSRLVDDQSQWGGAEMLLGADFLKQVHVWISHSSQTLVMQFPPQPSPALP